MGRRGSGGDGRGREGGGDGMSLCECGGFRRDDKWSTG